MARPRRQHMKNAAAEADQFRRRALVGFLAIAAAVLGLAFGYFRLQVLQHTEYQLRAEANRIKPRPVVPARGLIFDRAGRLLADNVPAFRLEVVPEQVEDLKATLAGLAERVALTPDDLAQFEATRRVTRGFRPVVLKLRLSEAERARLAVDRFRFPGVDVVPYLTRRYPYGDRFAHVVGYVGRLDVKDLEALQDSRYAALSHVGKSGIERAYEERLRGEIGYEAVETNVEGRAIRIMPGQPAKPGHDLRLSIDADLQEAAILAFGDLEGSAVALDPRTGEVLAMVSLPSYDPNLFVNGISVADYRRLMDNPSRALFNRNVLGGGPPGSTIKPVLALVGLESGLRTPQDRVLSTGTFYIPGQSRGYRDSHAHGHGSIDLRESIAQSVNTYYYKLALDLGIERFDTYMSRFGFGAPTGIDLIGENPGILPGPEWKRAHSKEQWYTGETVIAGIGQGYWKATTLQIARATASIADHGRLRRLHLGVAERVGFDQPWQPLPHAAPVQVATPANITPVIEGMIGTITHGTAYSMGIGAPYQIAGKTGTAQRVSRKGNISSDPKKLPMHLRHQAWFVGFAPAEAPRIVVAVTVEGGGYGAATAAPIARKIMDAWLLPKTADTPAPGEPDVAPAGSTTPRPRRAAPATPLPPPTRIDGLQDTDDDLQDSDDDAVPPQAEPTRPAGARR
jgi:penicillin-binding protein 2